MSGPGELERIGLVVHRGRPTAVAAADAVRSWAAAHGVDVVDVDVWSTDLPAGAAAPRRHAREEAEASGHPELIVTIGGDGTFLRGIRVAAGDCAPVLGVNVGRVGFLTEVDPLEVATALDRYAAGDAAIEERLTLTMCASRHLEIPPDLEAWLKYGRGPLLPPPPHRGRPAAPPGGPAGEQAGVPLAITALNDIVFEKLARDRQASVAVHVGGDLLASYSADAFIVSSPTGSTAYSFSAGGPLLSPRLQGLVLTPVAPHMIFNRSLVVAREESVSVRVLERSGQVAVSVDGQLRGVLDPGDWIEVTADERPARLVRLRSPDFYARVRDRFGLRDAPAAVADGAPPERQ